MLVLATTATALYAHPAAADAAWSTHFGGPGGITIRACKVPVSSGYGPLWKVWLSVSNSGTSQMTGTALTRRASAGHAVVNRFSATLPGRSVRYGSGPAYGYVYLSRISGLGDYLVIGGGEGTGIDNAGQVALRDVRYC